MKAAAAAFIRNSVLCFSCNERKVSFLQKIACSAVSTRAPYPLEAPTPLRRTIHSISAASVPFVSVTHIKNSLTKLNILYEEGYSCLSVECPICKSSDTSMYINKISGFFICTECRKSGEWKVLEYAFAKSDLSFSAVSVNESMALGMNEWTRILQSSVEKVTTEKLNTILQNCKLKNVKQDLLNNLNARINLEKSEIYIPLKNGSHIVGYKSIKPGSDEETIPGKSGFGIILIEKKIDSAVIVYCIKDLLALASCNIPHNIICLPHGQQSLPQEILPLFEQYKKLVLWFGNDITSWDNVRIFAKKLYEQRCFLVRPLETQPAPHSALELGYNVSTIIEKAQPISHASITTFSQLREDVLSEIFNIDKVAGVKWQRFPMLNSLLKGHRRGELTVLTGPTGSGKTTFISEYSLDLAMQGVTTLWGSFEIRNQRLARTMLQQFVLTPLDDNLSMFNVWADSFEQLPLYFMTFHGQQSIDLVMEAVEHASYVHDIAHVVIDNVQFMLGLSATESGFLDRFYRQDALIAAFRNFATMFNVHVTLVIHPRKEKEGEQLSTNSIFGGAKASQEADNVLIIQQRALQSLKIKKFLQIAKNRYCGDLGIMPLDFDKASLSFAKKETKNI